MDFTKCVTLVGALLLLGVVLPSEACRCREPGHLQQRYCNSTAAIKTKFISATQGVPTTSVTNSAGRGYVSETLQVLKGNQSLQSSTFIENYMGDTSCRYSHPADGLNTPFLLMGPVINGSVGVAGCSFPQRWSKLTAKQIAGLEGVYQQGCGVCEITPPLVCVAAPCVPASNTCTLENDNQKENQACLPDGPGSCAWKTIP